MLAVASLRFHRCRNSLASGRPPPWRLRLAQRKIDRRSPDPTFGCLAVSSLAARRLGPVVCTGGDSDCVAARSPSSARAGLGSRRPPDPAAVPEHGGGRPVLARLHFWHGDVSGDRFHFPSLVSGFLSSGEPRCSGAATLLGRMLAAIVLLLTAVAVFGATIADPFIRAVLDERYWRAAQLVPWVIGGYLFHAVFAMFQLSASPRPKSTVSSGSSASSRSRRTSA